MNKMTKKRKLTLIMLLIVSIFSVIFISAMGFLNYRVTAIELEDNVITRIEEDTVSGIESSLGFGKSFTNFYGMDDIFAAFSKQYPGPQPFVISKSGELMYGGSSEGKNAYTEDELREFVESSEFRNSFSTLEKNNNGVLRIGRSHVALVPIHQEYDVAGYFCAVYSESIFNGMFKAINRAVFFQSLAALMIICASLIIFQMRTTSHGIDKRRRSQAVKKFLDKTVPILIIAAGVLLLSFASLYSYQQDYREKTNDAIRMSLNSLETRIDDIRSQGVELRDVEGLDDYIKDRIKSIDTLRSVKISEQISVVNMNDEQSDIITFMFGDENGDEALFLEAELSDSAMQRSMREIVLVLFSTTIILLIFVYELTNLIDLFTAGLNKDEDHDEKIVAEGVFSEKRVAIALRFTGLLCSTAEYMCVPYAAMMIRASGQSLFGLSLGMTAALPLTLEGLTQMIGMLTMPKYVKKFDIKKVLIVSSIVMMVCNLSAFAVGSAIMIIICRAIAGFAYSGFKQVSNYLITSGYETDAGRSDNISQDNAGLLAGATCGAGLGAIISANSGFNETFLFSALLFGAYLAGTLMLVPWDMIAKKAAADSEETGEQEPVNVKALFKMFSSPEILKYIVLIGIPLNIGVMLCVTLIPAICQTNNISSVMLSYCYIANGIAGIYIGPALVSRAKKRFGTLPCLAFTFAITAVSIFILKIPPIAVMIIISSTILGFLDGFGTPLTTDRFMELNVVKESVDESTALIFSVVLSYVLLTFAPMVAELLLLPGKGVFTPMMAGALLYAAAAVLILLDRGRKKLKSTGE